MTFEEAKRYVASLQNRGWRLGLDRMEAFIELAQLQPATGPAHPSFIHVAGTNGKGSVTATLESIFHKQGFRSGGFFSPFVYEVRERVTLDCEPISPEAFASAAAAVLPAAEALASSELEGPTEFEFKTAMGFAAWKEAACEWVALEVGLGGRLDATNVVSPKCSVIVSIGLDHTAILGDTIELIAREKAGIIKPRVPVVCGDLPDPALQVVEEICRDLGCMLWRFGQEIRLDGHTLTLPTRQITDLVPGLKGPVQKHNMAVAVAAAEAAGAIRDPLLVPAGVIGARLPGRFEYRKVGRQTWILDGAHNADSAEVLAETLKAQGIEKVTLLAGMLEGHDARALFKPLLPFAERILLAPIQFHRARKPEDLAHELEGHYDCLNAYESVSDAIEAAKSSDSPVLVTGSFYLVGEVGNALKRERQ